MLGERGQGAVEYLLMVAVALVIVAVAVFYLMKTKGLGGRTINKKTNEIEEALNQAEGP